MDVTKFKIWDDSLREFAKDPNAYVTFSSYFSSVDQSIHAYPVLNPARLFVVILHCTGRKDLSGTDIYEGDRVRFYDTSKETYQQETVVFRSGLIFVLGNVLFEDVINLEVIGHRFDGKEDSDQFKLFHNI